MYNILIINSCNIQCGVYQYGKRVGKILEKSTNLNISYHEINNSDDFFDIIEIKNPHAILYNLLHISLYPWHSPEIKNKIKEKKILQGNIIHLHPDSEYFDFYFNQNPNAHEEKNKFNLLRPLFKYNETSKKTDSITRIGTFGFGSKSKNCEKICKMVNDQFNKDIEINIHLTCQQPENNHKKLQEIKNDCFNQITKDHIKIQFTSDFISDDEILNLLGKNDLNIFMYEMDGYNGISSCIDYALSVRKPIAVTKCSMYSHITKKSPSICIEQLSLPDILNNGFTPLLDFYNQWSHENFISKFEKNIHQILNRL